MKKIFNLTLIVICLCVSLVFFACNEPENEPPKETQEIELNLNTITVYNTYGLGKNENRETIKKSVILLIGFNENVTNFKIEVTLYFDDNTTQTSHILNICTLSNSQLRRRTINNIDLFRKDIDDKITAYDYEFFFTEYPNLTRAKITKLVGIFEI